MESFIKICKAGSKIALTVYSISCLLSQNASAQNVGIGAASFTPDAQSILEIQSTSRGVLIPRMTDVQRIAISPTVGSDFGMLVYQTNTVSTTNAAGYWYWDGAVWVNLDGGLDWSLTGNSGTNPLNNFIGTTDVSDFVMRTSNVERARIESGGNFGIGTTNPTATLSVGTGSTNKLNINGTDGDLTFTDQQGSIIFPTITASGNPAMMYMFNGASVNSRMVIGHSLAIPARGILYDDAADKFIVTPDGGTTTKMSISAVSSTAIVGVGTNVPSQMLSIAAGMNVDNDNTNSGTTTHALLFGGSGSNEGIASKRTAGGNQEGLDFYQNGINRMRIWNNGQVAIGQNSSGSLTPEADLTILNSATTSNADIPVFTARHSGSAGTTWRMGSIEYYTEGSANIGFTDDLCPIDGDGTANLGGTSNSRYLGHRWGTLYCVNAVNVSSDTTLKQNIAPVSYGLDQIRKINPISYKLKKDYGSTRALLSDDDKRTHIGFNAQELKQVIPEIVSSWDWVCNNENGFIKAKTESLGVYYDELIPVTVNAIKDLDRQQQNIIETINLSDFGTEQGIGSEMKITFSESFSQKVNGKATVTVTALQPDVTLYVTDVTEKGFTVRTNSITPQITFNWMALAKINKNELQVKSNYTEAQHTQKLKEIEAYEASLPEAKDIIKKLNVTGNNSR